MAKSKKNRKAVAQSRTKAIPKDSGKMNPFEVRINRQKHNILGKKTKHDRGMPGISRSKAMKKRTATLLEEYRQRHKTNKFLDKRLGEHDPDMSVEDKMMQRFTFERQKSHEKSSVYNLAEEEDLTHYGQSLSEIEKFEMETSDVDDDEEDRLAAKEMVEENFGGLFKKRTDEDTPKSHQDVMMEIIAKSKKEKYDRQKEKETTDDMTAQLDKEWKDVSMLLAGIKNSKDADNKLRPKADYDIATNVKDADDKRRPKADDYDIAVRELMFDYKATAKDRLKTPEELAKEEKEQLEKLEADRQKRMKGITEDEKPKHYSADDLNDGFEIFAEDRMMLSYKDGKPLNKKFFTAAQEATKGSSDEESDEDEEEDDIEEKESNEEEDKHLNNGNNILESKEENGKETAESDGDEEEEDEDEDDDDLVSDDESDADDDKTSKEKTDIEEEKSKKIEMIKAAKEELPYTFTAPSSFDDLYMLLFNHTTPNQLTIIERLCKCHHPSLAEGNKDKLQNVMSYLVDYFCVVCDSETLDMELIDGLTRTIYELSKLSHHHTGSVFQGKVVEMYEEFNSICEEKGYGIYPPASSFLYLKLLSVVFPTSDFRHCVITPAMLYMGQMLARCRVRNMRDVGCGLFLCNLFLQYVQLSKRVVPEVINFLHGLLFLSSTKQPKKIYPVCLPFKPVGKFINLLVLQENSDSESSSKLKPYKLETVLAKGSNLDTDEFRIWTMNLSLKLLTEFTGLYEEHSSSPELFQPINQLLGKNMLKVDNYPDKTMELYNSFKKQLDSLQTRLKKPLMREKKRPVPLKQFEPKIEDNYDPTRKTHSTGNKDVDNMKKLKYKYRKEMKGAVREIKKDTQFIARQKLKEQMTRDAERKQKVKEIEHMLASQEGDYNALQRKKGKFKKF